MMESQRCVYCGCAVGKYQRVCSECYIKLNLVRRILAIGKMIREGKRNDLSD